MLVRVFTDWVVKGRKPWPTPAHIERGEVFVDQEDISEYIRILEGRRYVLIAGGEGRGKSTTAKLIGYNRSKFGQRIYVIDCSVHGKQTVQQVTTMIENYEGEAPLWIIDDYQVLDPDELAELSDSIMASKKSWFVFITRVVKVAANVDIYDDDDLLSSVIDLNNLRVLRPSAGIISGVIGSYVEARRHEARFAEQLSEITPEDLAFAEQTSGGNLRTLTAYLDAWNPRQEPLHSLKPETIWESIYNSRVEPLVLERETLAETYLDVSAIGQFDVPIWSGCFSESDLSSLEQRGLIGRGTGVLWLPHGSDGRHNVEAFSRRRGITTAVLTKRALVKYIRAEPPTDVLNVLLMPLTSEPIFADPDFRQLVEDGVARGKSLTLAASYLREFGKDKTSVQELITKMGGTNRVADLLRKSRVSSKAYFLAGIRRVTPGLADELESGLSVEDKIAIYARSPMGVVSKSLYYYVNKGSIRFAKGILQQVLQTRFEQRVKRSSLNTCSRLLQVAPRVDAALASEAARKIANNVNLSGSETSEKFGLIVTNTKFDPPAYDDLVRRLVHSVAPLALLKPERRKGYTHLLGLIRPFVTGHPEISHGRMFFEAFLSVANQDITRELDDRQLSRTIWQFLVVGISPHAWLARVQQELRRRVYDSALDGVFWILLQVLQVDEGLFRQLLISTSDKLPSRLTKCATSEPAALPMIGLFAYVDFQHDWAMVAPSSETVANYLFESKSSNLILFGLLGARAVGIPLFDSIVGSLNKSREDLVVMLQQLIDESPLPQSRERLRHIFERLFGKRDG